MNSAGRRASDPKNRLRMTWKLCDGLSKLALPHKYRKPFYVIGHSLKVIMWKPEAVVDTPSLESTEQRGYTKWTSLFFLCKEQTRYFGSSNSGQKYEKITWGLLLSSVRSFILCQARLSANLWISIYGSKSYSSFDCWVFFIFNVVQFRFNFVLVSPRRDP